MNKIFLEKYHQELKFFRDAAKAFAEEHPQAAPRLGLAAPEIEDPYVERLIEAVSFLTARINLKIDAEYPRFVHHLLKVIHPDLVQPYPSVAVAELCPSDLSSIVVDQGSGVITKAKTQGQATCQFSVCGKTQIFPFQIQKINYSHNISDLNSLQQKRKDYKSILKISLKIPSGFFVENFQISNLQWFISSHDLKVSSELLFFIAEKCQSIQVDLNGNVDWKHRLKPDFTMSGFNEFISFFNKRSTSYLKHIVDYAVLPDKYLFFKINNLIDVIDSLKDHGLLEFQKTELGTILSKEVVLDLNFIFNDTSELLNKYLDDKSLSLNSVILNNAFSESTRVLVDQLSNEQHIVIDRLRPRDYEVISVERVEGYSKSNHQIKLFEPIYKLNNNTDHFNEATYGFFSETYRQSHAVGKKNSYKGSECYILLTNQLKYGVENNLNQISVDTWCSNRALPSEISWSLDQDLKMADDSLKIKKIKRHSSFTTPIPAPIENASLWRLLNLVSSNFISLNYENTDELTQQIKNNLYLFYEITNSISFKSQVNAIQSIEAEKIRKVIRVKNHLSPVSGMKFVIQIDEMLMSHVHPYLWGRVLLEYLKGFSPMNQFIELELKNSTNELISAYTTLSV